MDNHLPDQFSLDTRVSTDSYEVTQTVDCAIFGFSNEGLKVLLAKRAIDPYKGSWVLPGGMVQQGQTLETAAANVLDRLLNVHNVYMRQIKTYSSLTRHPVKRVITTGFYALVKPENLEFSAQGYITEACWILVEQVKDLGFDHSEIVADALEKLKRDASYNPLSFHLLPEKFTLKELQDLHEVILGEVLDRRNFRRKVTAMELVIETDEKKSGVKGGPKLFTLNPNAKDI